MSITVLVEHTNEKARSVNSTSFRDQFVVVPSASDVNNLTNSIKANYTDILEL